MCYKYAIHEINKLLHHANLSILTRILHHKTVLDWLYIIKVIVIFCEYLSSEYNMILKATYNKLKRLYAKILTRSFYREL